jgi:hypothetical protein
MVYLGGGFKWISKMFQRRKRTSAKDRQSKILRKWRLIDLGDSGMYCYFDPYTERIEILSLTKDEKLDIVGVSPLCALLLNQTAC